MNTSYYITNWHIRNNVHYIAPIIAHEDLYILVKPNEKIKKYLSDKRKCCFSKNCLQKLAGIDNLRNPDKILLRDMIKYFSICIRHARNSTNNLKLAYKANPSIAILKEDMLEDVLETSIMHMSQMLYAGQSAQENVTFLSDFKWLYRTQFMC